jgi:hypothetical protein
MAFKLTGDEKKDLAMARKASIEAWVKYCDAIQDVQNALDDYIEKRKCVLTVVNIAAERMREEFNDKSEGWQQGDKGSDADSFISEWENIEVDDPDTVDMPDGDPLDEAIDALPEEL